MLRRSVIIFTTITIGLVSFLRMILSKWAEAAAGLKLWQISDSGVVWVRILMYGEDVYSVTFSPDGKLLASGNYYVKLWQVPDGHIVKTLEGTAPVAFSPEGKILATRWKDIVKLWDVTSGSLIRILQGETDQVTSIAFSPNGRLLALGSNNGIIKVWRVANGNLIHTLKGHAGGVLSVTFSPDGQLLASGGGTKPSNCGR